LELQRKFDEMKAQWLAAGYPVEAVYSRIGIACGEVHQVSMGHPQYQHSTLMGATVNASNALCEAGTRLRNVVLVDDESYRRTQSTFTFNTVPVDELGKAARFVREAHLLLGTL